MPNQAGRKTLLRLLELLRLVSANTGQQTTANLAKALANSDFGFTPTRRTIERDLKLLESLRVIRCNRKGKPGGWTFNRGTSFVIPGIGIPEALSLTLLRDFLEQMLPLSLWEGFEPRLDASDKTLREIAGHNRAARWADKIRYVQPTLPLIPPKIDKDILGAVQEALLNDLQLKVGYRAIAADKPKSHTLNPLGIMQRGSTGYLIATVKDHNKIYFYALHRIHKAEVLDLHPAQRPTGFSLDAYIASQGQFSSDNPVRDIRLRARAVPDLAHILEETALSPDQKLRPIPDAEDSIVTATLPDTWQLRWWLLSQGARIKVLAPKALRQTIAEEIAEPHKTYRKTGKKKS